MFTRTAQLAFFLFWLVINATAAAPRPATRSIAKAATPALPSKRLAPVLVAPNHALVPVKAVTVTGTVLGADGLPLAGATVWLENTGLRLLAVTNSDGVFTLTLPNDLPATLTIGYVGLLEEIVALARPSKMRPLAVTLFAPAKR